jgi:hypothetical protein
MNNPLIDAIHNARAKRGWSTEPVEPLTRAAKAAAVESDDEQPSDEVKSMLSPKRIFASLIARD